jgi:DinB superfamily
MVHGDLDMKRLTLALAIAVTLPLSAAAPLSQQDRDTLIKDLENSRAVFLKAIADVNTEAQWNYKPAPDRWSVAECAAHIVAAEQYFRDNIAATLKTPALPAEKQSTAGDTIIAKMGPRSFAALPGARTARADGEGRAEGTGGQGIRSNTRSNP